MGAFNAWVKGSFLEAPENRSVVQLALNLLEGAAVIGRAQQLLGFGIAVPAAAFSFAPRQFC
jgi:trans-AT polyketide synthase, acyltransferase and oxidoreductase domains